MNNDTAAIDNETSPIDKDTLPVNDTSPVDDKTLPSKSDTFAEQSQRWVVSNSVFYAQLAITAMGS